jgi:hypothetical protein
MVEAVIEAIENAGLRFDLAAAVVGGIISYARLKVELADFFSQALPRARYSIGDLFTAAFGSHAHTGLLVLGVLSGAALGFILTRSLMSVFRVAFPEVIKQVAESDPKPQLVPYRLPPWPDEGQTPQFVIGEEHHSDGKFCSTPSWHVIPLKGLVGSVLVVGAPGTAKTAAVILPFIEQLTEFRARDPASKVSLFVLDRKGSLGGQVRKIAERHGRSRDLVVLRLGGPKLNLLSDALPAASIAAALVAANSLRQAGASHDEPEWIKSGIYRIFWHALGIYRLAYGPTTLKDLCQLLSGPLRADPPPDEPNTVPEQLKKELERYYKAFQARLSRGDFPDPAAAAEEEFEYHAQYFEHQFVRMNARNKATLIDAALDLVEPFASPQLAETFCPTVRDRSQTARDRPQAAKVEYPGMSALMESGHIVVFEPDERLGRAAVTIAILLKLEFQRAALGRLKQAEATGEPISRLWGFVADEYQSFVSVGGQDEGDDGFVALSREALITNVFATQSLAGLQARIGEPKLRTLMGAIRTKLFLTLTDPSDCQLASRIAGEDYRRIQSTSFSEANKNARLNPVTDTLQAGSTTVSEQRSYSEQLRPDFLPVAFSRLQTFEAIACVFDGQRQRDPVKLYLKPAFLPRELPHNQFPHHKRAAKGTTS